MDKLNNFEQILALKEKEQIRKFDITEKKEDELGKKLSEIEEEIQLNVEQILKNLEVEKSKFAKDLDDFKNTIDKIVLEKELSETDESKRHVEKIHSCLHEVSKNETKHIENVRLNTVNTSRIRSNVKETEENFSKLLFVQSRNSHDAIANKLHDFSNKVGDDYSKGIT